MLTNLQPYALEEFASAGYPSEEGDVVDPVGARKAVVGVGPLVT
jgi:hypothetical protein